MILPRLLLAAALAAPLAAPARAQATIEGRVELAKSRPPPVENKRYSMTAKGGVLADSGRSPAVVYLEGAFPGSAAPAARQIVQQDLAFVPDLLAVQVGTRVDFPNRDDVEHSVYSTSKANAFDLGRIEPGGKPAPSRVFSQPGLVTIRCDVHEHMRAQILVLATPYFALTDGDGRFRLGGLPAGHYVLKAWLNGKTTLERPVDLQSGSALTVNFP